MTSHIDIAPSVLDLLGIEDDRGLELGSPMWEPALADRTTFFFARSYLGADGYQRSNEAVMVRYLYGGVLRAEWNGALRFRATDLINEPDGNGAAPGRRPHDDGGDPGGTGAHDVAIRGTAVPPEPQPERRQQRRADRGDARTRRLATRRVPAALTSRDVRPAALGAAALPSRRRLA